MLEITSKDNARLKIARSVRQGRESDLIFVEGLRLAEELATAALKITDYFFTPELAQTERGTRLLKKLPSECGAIVNKKLLALIADTKTPQGIVALARKPKTEKEFLLKRLAHAHASASANLLIIVLHQLNNPANVGAILRTAEAAGCAGAILTATCADPFAPKSLRGAMGSAFRLPLWTNADFGEAIEFCRANKIKTVSTELNASQMYTEIDWTPARALVIGSEADGLAPAEISQTDESVRITMQAPVESLNAAVACGVILYEAVRQRLLTN